MPDSAQSDCRCPECSESGESHGPTCGCKACNPDGTFFADSSVPGGYVEVGVYAERVETERDRYREALERLADPDGWDRYKRPHRHTVQFARETLSV